jgi:hypothetical protein
MGSEALCRVTYDGRSFTGKALLETSELLFRSDDLRLKIPFRDITSLSEEEGALRIAYGPSVAVFEIGGLAGTWASKIRNPRGLMEKLGVKPGQRVSVIGVTDADFLSQLHDVIDTVGGTSPPEDSDFVFYEADSVDDLSRLQKLRDTIAPKGAIWVVSPKGKGAPVKDTDVMAAAREAGLVDTKVVAFSTTHTALKLVIPVAKRPAGG